LNNRGLKTKGGCNMTEFSGALTGGGTWIGTSGSGTILIENGSVTANLHENANGAISGRFLATAEIIVNGGAYEVADGGTVSGHGSHLTYTANQGLLLDGTGSISHGGKEASFLVQWSFEPIAGYDTNGEVISAMRGGPLTPAAHDTLSASYDAAGMIGLHDSYSGHSFI
jgi:hypothetical protein